jgi:hypothetical protein
LFSATLHFLSARAHLLYRFMEQEEAAASFCCSRRLWGWANVAGLSGLD